MKFKQEKEQHENNDKSIHSKCFKSIFNVLERQIKRKQQQQPQEKFNHRSLLQFSQIY